MNTHAAHDGTNCAKKRELEKVNHAKKFLHAYCISSRLGTLYDHSNWIWITWTRKGSYTSDMNANYVAQSATKVVGMNLAYLLKTNHEFRK